jgi:hypothetical protein
LRLEGDVFFVIDLNVGSKSLLQNCISGPHAIGFAGNFITNIILVGFTNGRHHQNECETRYAVGNRKKKEDKGGNLVSQSIRWNLKERQMSGKMFRNLVYGLTGLMAGMSVITTIAKKKMEVALRNCSNNSLGMKDHRVYLSLGGKKLVRKRAIWKNELNPHATRHTNTQKKICQATQQQPLTTKKII